VLQRTHVVQTVGQLDDDHAYIRHHGQQHLADVLRLVVLAVGELDLVEFGHALDDVGHLIAEAPREFERRDVRVLDSVMQQAGADRSRIHLELGKHLRDLERMDDVLFARLAQLS